MIALRRPFWGLMATFLALGVMLLLSWPHALPAQTVSLGAPPDAVALVPRSGKAFVASASAGTVSLLDLRRGRVLRTAPAGDPRTLAPLALALDPVTLHLFVAIRSDSPAPSVVQMLDSRSGARLASIPVGHEAAALAVDARRGYVLVANETDGTLSLLNARSGALLRTVAVGLLPLAVAVDEHTARAFVVGPVVPGDGTPPMWARSAPAGLLSVLDTRTGALVRVTPVGSGPDALVVDGRTARVFVANSGAGTVSVLDVHDGTLLRTIPLGGQPTTLAVDERRARVYVACAAAGTLSLLDARSGTLLATRRVDPFASAAYTLPDALAVDAARDRVYLSTDGPLVPGPRGLTLRGNGMLYVLDARTGTVVRRITVGVAPQAVAVDESSGRVVVINSGGEVLHWADGWLEEGLRRLRVWLPWLSRVTPSAPSITRVPGSVSVLDLRGP